MPCSPLPGERLHLQLQAVDLVSEVLLEEPVVQLSRLAAALSLAQSGCEPHELVIKNKSHGGEEDQVHKHKVKQPREDSMVRRRGKVQDGEGIMMGKTMEKKQTLKKNKMKVKQAEEKLVFYFFFYSSSTVYSH